MTYPADLDEDDTDLNDGDLILMDDDLIEEIDCPYCDGEGVTEDGAECDTCDGVGTLYE